MHNVGYFYYIKNIFSEKGLWKKMWTLLELAQQENFMNCKEREIFFIGPERE
jgi:hypothetical protein